MSGEGVLASGRHDVGFSERMQQFDQAIVARNQCGHGIIGYCRDCAAMDVPPLDYPDQTGMRDFPGALPGPLLSVLATFCVGVTENRPPNQVIGRKSHPYIDRWFLARKAQVPEFSTAPGYEDLAPYMPSEIENTYLHGYHRGDADDPHDHPWPNASLVVRGWYRENIHALDGRLIGSLVRRPGDIVLRSATSIHAITETSGDCLSLFATLPKERDWGFWTTGGFVPWREFGNP